MANTFGEDANGVYKRLGDGRVLRIQRRMFNCILTASESQEDDGWYDGW